MEQQNKNLIMLLDMLNDGRYHDITAIEQKLNFSPDTIKKLISKLNTYNKTLSYTEGKGYKIKNPLILLDTNKLADQLRHHKITLKVLEKTSSTNDAVQSLIKNNKDIAACFAEHQTAGKGRMQRYWHSPIAENIYLSISYPLDKHINELNGLSLIVALATCHAIESTIDLYHKDLDVKWPNDILIDGHKVAGILIETETDSNNFCRVIIGIGINVNMNTASKNHINQKWISLSQVTKHYTDRNILGAKLIDALIDYLQRFSSTSFMNFQEEWKKRDALAGSIISMQTGKKETQGLCLGTDHHGHIQIKTENNNILTFASGESTLLK